MNTLHEKAVQYAKDYKRGERNLVSILVEVEDKRVFEAMGYSSLFSYCVKALDLGESHTSLLIAVARKSRVIPELRELQISKARQLVDVITVKNKEEWLTKARELSQRSLEKEIAKTKPEKAIRETVKPVTPTKSELRVGISHELEAKIEKLKNLLSQKMKKPCSLEEVLDFATDEALKKTEKVRGKLRQSITVRDERQCTFTEPDGKRCEQKRWLDIHHIIPRSKGGQDTLENLTTLCSTHHHHLHRRAKPPSRPSRDYVAH